MIKERNATWHKSSKESQKRGEDLWTQAEELRTQGSKDDKNRKVPVDGLRRLKKIRDEEEELKKITDELLERRRIQEDELWQVFEDYMQRHGITQKERSTALQNTHAWQMNQSSDTKTQTNIGSLDETCT